MDWDTQWGEQRLSTQMKEAAPMGDNEVPFGYLARFDDAVSSENIVFVMKAGKVYKTGGKPVV
ncbi:amidohydrolase family protein [Rhizoctonia solani]|uniref:Amidohydrolase family protein n=1 Tax=Rhizoctonia solani TaxID=456999 RepID=A0A8H8NNL4_9AGAM|nr:amidohydrolase family protein [Rhizoctonia solani]QRW17014.1 amidohydrolase family protein [Rhizoctonia solani]